jgi:hypothetical protein
LEEYIQEKPVPPTIYVEWLRESYVGEVMICYPF